MPASHEYRLTALEERPVLPGGGLDGKVLTWDRGQPVWSSSLNLPGSLAVGGALDLIGNLTIDGTGDGIRIYRYSDNADAVVLFPRKARGIKGSPAAIQNNDGLIYLSAAGWTTSGGWTAAGILQLDVDAAPSSTNVQGRWIFSTRDSGGNMNEVLRLDSAKLAAFKGPVTATGMLQATVAATGDKALGLESLATGTPNERTHLASTTSVADGTLATIHTIPTSSNKAYHVEAHIAGRRTSGGAEMGSFHIAGSFRNVSGTLTQRGTTTVIHTAKDDANMAGSFAVSGTNIQVQIGWATAYAMQWIAAVKVSEV